MDIASFLLEGIGYKIINGLQIINFLITSIWFSSSFIFINFFKLMTVLDSLCLKVGGLFFTLFFCQHSIITALSTVLLPSKSFKSINDFSECEETAAATTLVEQNIHPYIWYCFTDVGNVVCPRHFK